LRQCFGSDNDTAGGGHGLIEQGGESSSRQTGLVFTASGSSLFGRKRIYCRDRFNLQNRHSPLTVVYFLLAN
jgi:hypothetical protein